MIAITFFYFQQLSVFIKRCGHCAPDLQVLVEKILPRNVLAVNLPFSL